MSLRQLFNNLFNSNEAENQQREEKLETENLLDLERGRIIPEFPPVNDTDDILDLGLPNALNELEQFTNQAATDLYAGVNSAFNWATNQLSWLSGQLYRSTVAREGMLDTITNAVTGTHTEISDHQRTTSVIDQFIDSMARTAEMSMRWPIPQDLMALMSVMDFGMRQLVLATHRSTIQLYESPGITVHFSIPLPNATKFERNKIVEIIKTYPDNLAFDPKEMSHAISQFFIIARPSVHNNFRNIPYTQFEALCYEHCAAIFLEACQDEPETVQQIYHNLFADMDLGMATDVISNVSNLPKELNQIFNSNNTSIVPLGFFKPAHIATQEILQQAQQQRSQTRLTH